MPDYKALYFALFRASVVASEGLLQAQQEAEELFLQQTETSPLQVMQKKRPSSQSGAPFEREDMS